MAEITETEYNQIKVDCGDPFLNELLPALHHLDEMLKRALDAAPEAFGAMAAGDPYRGLYIDKRDAERFLDREPGEPPFGASGDARGHSAFDFLEDETRLGWLQRAFVLSDFDLYLILIALAPELDLRYESLYAYLQDNVTRRRPTVDLALNLLCDSAESKLSRRVHFAADSPLVRNQLLSLLPDAHQLEPPLLSHYLKLDEQIVNLLLGQEVLDRRLASFCELVEPSMAQAEETSCDEPRRSLVSLLNRTHETQQPFRLYLQGQQSADKSRLAEALAAHVEKTLLVVNLERALAAEEKFEHLLMLVFREARFKDVALSLSGVDALSKETMGSHYRSLLDALSAHSGLVIMAGEASWHYADACPPGVLSVNLTPPDFTERRACWQKSLEAERVRLNESELDALADRFRLTPNRIQEAVVVACQSATLRSCAGAPETLSMGAEIQPSLDELYAAARAQSNQNLSTLGRKIEPVYTWEEIVLPADALAQLRELCQRVVYRRRVLGGWGFARKLSLGKGVNALFVGPSGTGKTMAAEVIAHELGLDLYKIDLAGVVSKWIGETEKNLKSIFDAAERGNAILFFDEADALFGKRSEVRDSHDRYANLEVSYLLQLMEEYEGVSILASNLRQNLDDSFVRRLAFVVHFPFPDEDNRRRIWTSIWPDETPLAADLDFHSLARQFKLSGGSIKNIALGASFLAAANGGVVTMEHLLHATRREYQKAGKNLSAEELRCA